MTIFIIEYPRSADGMQIRFLEELSSELMRKGTVVLTGFRYDLKREDSAVRRIREKTESEQVVSLGWTYPRAQRILLDFWGCGAEDILCVDLREHSEIELVSKIIDDWLSERQVLDIPGVKEALVERTSHRWYPLIDYERCANCKECLNFCLFGVYGINLDGRVYVETPDACRNGCPACARVCPQEAILFPLSPEAGIAGAPNARIHHEGSNQERNRAMLDRLVDEIDAE